MISSKKSGTMDLLLAESMRFLSKNLMETVFCRAMIREKSTTLSPLSDGEFLIISPTGLSETPGENTSLMMVSSKLKEVKTL